MFSLPGECMLTPLTARRCMPCWTYVATQRFGAAAQAVHFSLGRQRLHFAFTRKERKKQDSEGLCVSGQVASTRNGSIKRPISPSNPHTPAVRPTPRAASHDFSVCGVSFTLRPRTASPRPSDSKSVATPLHKRRLYDFRTKTVDSDFEKLKNKTTRERKFRRPMSVQGEESPELEVSGSTYGTRTPVPSHRGRAGGSCYLGLSLRY